MARRILKKVGKKYGWFIKSVPFGEKKFSTKVKARKYLKKIDKR